MSTFGNASCLPLPRLLLYALCLLAVGLGLLVAAPVVIADSIVITLVRNTLPMDHGAQYKLTMRPCIVCVLRASSPFLLPITL